MSKEKMTFLLAKDDDGYPPDDSETLWVEKVGECRYRIDNVPFYVEGISPDDIVEGEFLDGILMFKALLKKSSTSVIRLVFFEKDESPRVLAKLVEAKCRWEGSHLPSLFSVEVPASSDYEGIKDLLARESAKGVLDYEEASLR